MRTYLIPAVTLVALLAFGCGSAKYVEEKTLMTSVTKAMETLTAGIYLAGGVQAPKDIPAAVSQASAAAAKGLALLSQKALKREPTTAQVNDTYCVGCFECLQVCPYQAIEKKEIHDRQGNLLRTVSWANPAMCEGCGLCTVTCRSGCIDLDGYSDEQLFAQLAALAPLPEEIVL